MLYVIFSIGCEKMETYVNRRCRGGMCMSMYNNYVSFSMYMSSGLCIYVYIYIDLFIRTFIHVFMLFVSVIFDVFGCTLMGWLIYVCLQLYKCVALKWAHTIYMYIQIIVNNLWHTEV